jgi:hypothetical protein
VHPPCGRTGVSLEGLRAEIEALTVPDEREAAAGFFDGAVAAVGVAALDREADRPESAAATTTGPADLPSNRLKWRGQGLCGDKSIAKR